MKKITLKLIAICFVFIIAQSCKKDDTVFDCYFYTDKQDLVGKLELYIDNQYKGNLNSITADFKNFPDSLKPQTLQLKLKSGKYEIKVTDQNANNKVLSKMTISDNRTKTTGTQGGTSMAVKGTEMIVLLNY